MRRGIVLLSLILASALSACQAAGGTETAGYQDIGPSELATMLDSKDFFFVNTHIPYEGEIAQTDAFVPYNEVEGYLDQLPADKDARIVLYCRSGRMSSIAAEVLADLGYTQLFNLEGGMIAWEEAGLPLLHR